MKIYRVLCARALRFRYLSLALCLAICSAWALKCLVLCMCIVTATCIIRSVRSGNAASQKQKEGRKGDGIFFDSMKKVDKTQNIVAGRLILSPRVDPPNKGGDEPSWRDVPDEVDGKKISNTQKRKVLHKTNDKRRKG